TQALVHNKRPTMINHIEVTTVFVKDQDDAIAFYRDVLGMQVKIDTMMGEHFRWIEVMPEGAQTSIALLAPFNDEPIGVNTGMIFDTADVKAVYESWKDKVDFVQVPETQPWGGVQARFADPDGNVFSIAQKTA
ncbi:MAG: VOC family protein, partial [Chloroflexota bacterium]